MSEAVRQSAPHALVAPATLPFGPHEAPVQVVPTFGGVASRTLTGTRGRSFGIAAAAAAVVVVAAIGASWLALRRGRG